MKPGAVCGWVLVLATTAASIADTPVDSGKVETENVKLVLIDVVVVDGAGRSVPGLGPDDFEVAARGEVLPVDTLDVACPEQPIPDPTGVRRASKREVAEAPPEGRSIVLAFDYLHLPGVKRGQALDEAIEAVRHNAREGDRIMVAALNGGLRIEQPFTTDHRQVAASLDRMYYDITLWQPDFRHLTERSFVDGLTGLFDVLGTVPGRKAVVLYSMMNDVPLESEFERIAAVASASRCSLYPVDVRGLTTPGGSGGTPG